MFVKKPITDRPLHLVGRFFALLLVLIGCGLIWGATKNLALAMGVFFVTMGIASFIDHALDVVRTQFDRLKDVL